MDIKEFNRIAKIMGKKHVPEIISELKKKGWLKASDLSSYLSLSTATAVRYLKDMSDIDILKRRKVEGLTGEIWEYSIAEKRVIYEIELD